MTLLLKNMLTETETETEKRKRNEGWVDRRCVYDKALEQLVTSGMKSLSGEG